MPSALSHDPSITTPSASTDNAIVIFDGTGGTGFGNSTIVVDSGGNGRIGIATDTNLITFTNETVTVAGAVTASGVVTGATLVGTLTTAAQTNITSLSTLTALQVDNINLNGNTLTATSGAVNITPAAGSAIVLDGAVNVDAGVVTGVTSFTVDNINIDGNTISSTAGTDLLITPLGGQQLILDGLIVIDNGVVTGATSITSTEFHGGGGNLTGISGGIASVQADSTPELGGPLDVVTHDIVSTSNRDIDITPHGTGATVLSGEVKGSRAFVSLMTDLIEGGTHKSLFVLGNHGYASGVHNAYYGWGKEFQLYMSGSGSRTLMSQQAGFRGKGWYIESGAADQRYTALYAGGQVMAVNDDWTIIMRYFSNQGHTWGFGLVSNPQNYRPHNTASFNHIGIFGESGSSKPKLCTNASSNANQTVFTGTYSFAVEHVAKVTITEGGRYVKGYIDGILVGTHDANITNDRVPQGAENMFLYINISSYDSNARTLHISDFIAYTEV